MLKFIPKIVGCWVLLFAGALHAQILQTIDFETGNLSQAFTEVDGANAYVQASTDFARKGTYGLKSYLTTSDRRAEINNKYIRGTVGGENWYGWSVYIPAGFPGDGRFDIISQFHDYHGTQPNWGKDGKAPTHFQLANGDVKFDLKYQSGFETVAHTTWNLGAYTTGAWLDIVMNVSWDHTSNGFVKIWLNGVLKVDYTGPTYMNYPSNLGPYFKMGNYKGSSNWPGTSPRLLYFDEFKMGDATATYADVDPAASSGGGGGTNLALNRPVIVDSENSSTNAGSKAVDGNIGPDNSTRWVSDNAGYPHWIEVDLGGSKSVNQVKFYTGYNGYNHPVHDYQIQRWNGSSWVNIISKTGNSSAQVNEIFTAVTASKIRLYATAGNDNMLRLYEIEIYGSGTGGGGSDIIIDNTDAGFSVISGSWSTSTTKPDYYGTDYRHTTSGSTATKKVRWTPTIPSAGSYNVYYWLPDGDSNRATNAPFTIVYNGGSQTYTVNQQGAGGAWVLLGMHNFANGTSGYVELANNASGTYVIADAIKFSPAGSSSLVNNNLLTIPSQAEIRLFPNPVQDIAQLQLQSEGSEIVQGTVLDLSGKALLTFKQDLIKGVNMIEINTQSLHPGIYLLHITSDKRNKTLRFVVQGE